MLESFEETTVHIYSDSDWAGCRVSRKSTSGGVIVVGGCTLRAWSSTQTTVATSSGEAELYALVKAASEGLGFQSLARDVGFELNLEVHVDSSAAQSIASRVGLGKTKHVEVKYLWVQQATRDGRFVVRRVPSEENPADILTKPHSARRMFEVLGRLGFSIQQRDTNARNDLSWPRGRKFEEVSEGPLVFEECSAVRQSWADFDFEDNDFSMFRF
jgi:hypothetical protein